MKSFIENLHMNAISIANTRVADYVKDVDLLTVALCAGNLNEIANTLYDAPNADYKHVAAHRALDLGWNPALRKEKANAGFFANGLRGLLELSKQDSAAGTCLMPIFCELVSNPEKYGISSKLSAQLKNYMRDKKSIDGFAITCINDDTETVTVHASCRDHLG